MNAASDLIQRTRVRLAAALCCAAILGALLAGCGDSPDESTSGEAKSGVTTGADTERTDDSGKTGGTPNTHIDKSGDASK